jgi:hypothetical protein
MKVSNFWNVAPNLAYFSTLTSCSSETSVDLQRIIRCYIPEDRTIRYCCQSKEEEEEEAGIFVEIGYKAHPARSRCRIWRMGEQIIEQTEDEKSVKG